MLIFFSISCKNDPFSKLYKDQGSCLTRIYKLKNSNSPRFLTRSLNFNSVLKHLIANVKVFLGTTISQFSKKHLPPTDDLS